MVSLSINTTNETHANTLVWAVGNWADVYKITCQFEYSAACFKGGKRNNSSAKGVSIVILDFDEGLSLKQGIELFSSYKFLIVTTKSHQVDKHGIVTDRFRVILPLNFTIIDMKYYGKLMRIITRYFNSDIACSDAARYYSPNPKQLVHYSSSEAYFDIEKFDSLIEENIAPINCSKVTHKKIVRSIASNRVDLSDFLDETIHYYKNGVKNYDTLENFIINTEVSNKATRCHCFLNKQHEDRNPSCFIYRNDNNIYAKCVACGFDGVLQAGEIFCL